MMRTLEPELTWEERRAARRRRILGRRSVHAVRGACLRPGELRQYMRPVTRELADDPGLQSVLPVGATVHLPCVCGVALQCKILGKPIVSGRPLSADAYAALWPVEVLSHA